MDRFKRFFEIAQVRTGIVSFDFDGTLHDKPFRSSFAAPIHPLEFMNYEEFNPRQKIHRFFREEQKNGNEIIIITKRGAEPKTADYQKWNSQHRRAISRFLKKFGLDAREIVLTHGQSKRQALIKYHVLRHYDDDPQLPMEVADLDVEVILV